MPKPETKYEKSGQALKRAPLLHVSVQEACVPISRINGLPGRCAPSGRKAKLAARLGVSRNSVREAIKALESVGV